MWYHMFSVVTLLGMKMGEKNSTAPYHGVQFDADLFYTLV